MLLLRLYIIAIFGYLTSSQTSPTHPAPSQKQVTTAMKRVYIQCRYSVADCRESDESDANWSTNCVKGIGDEITSCYFICRPNINGGQCVGYCPKYREVCGSTTTPIKTTVMGTSKVQIVTESPNRDLTTQSVKGDCTENSRSTKNVEKNFSMTQSASNESIFVPLFIAAAILASIFLATTLCLCYLVRKNNIRICPFTSGTRNDFFDVENPGRRKVPSSDRHPQADNKPEARQSLMANQRTNTEETMLNARYCSSTDTVDTNFTMEKGQQDEELLKA